MMNETGIIRDAATIAAEINGIKGQVRITVVAAAVEIGRRLKEAKALVPFGAWSEWLKVNVDYSERTAQNMMRIADEYGGGTSPALADVGYTQAVLLLGVPKDMREEFVQENDIEGMSTRELQDAIAALKSEVADKQTTIDELMARPAPVADNGEAERARLENERLLREMEERAEDAARLQDDLAREKQALKKTVVRLERELKDARAASASGGKPDTGDSAEVKRLRGELETAKLALEKREKVQATVQADAEDYTFRAEYKQFRGNWERLMQALNNVGDDMRDKYREAVCSALGLMLEAVRREGKAG